MSFLFLLFTSAGVNTLLMPASARGVLTYYSRSTGDEAIFYNLVIFSAQDYYRLSFFYSNVYAAMKNLNLALSRRFNQFDFGISIMNFDYGLIEARPDYPTDDSTGFYTANDFCLGICASKSISTNGKLGMKMKYIYENIYIYSGATLGFDISLAYINHSYGMSIGATNIGGTIKIASESVNLPAKLSFGYSRNLNKLILSLDLHYLVNTQKFESSIAADMIINKSFELGISANYRDLPYPGFYFGFYRNSMYIKYGTSIYPYDLGMINSIGIGFLF